MTVDCPRCFKSRWHATGRFNISRHGLRRAECVCDFCGYAFSTGISAALEAADAVVAMRPTADAPPVATKQPTLPGAARPSALTPVAAIVRDFKQRAAGEGGDE